jgi:hypothetical protein
VVDCVYRCGGKSHSVSDFSFKTRDKLDRKGIGRDRKLRWNTIVALAAGMAVLTAVQALNIGDMSG